MDELQGKGDLRKATFFMVWKGNRLGGNPDSEEGVVALLTLRFEFEAKVAPPAGAGLEWGCRTVLGTANVSGLWTSCKAWGC